MSYTGAETQITLEPVPVNACEPVRAALTIVHQDIEESGGISDDVFSEAGLCVQVANFMSKTCQELCADGCIRVLYHQYEANGLSLPPSKVRDDFFTIVSHVLASEFVLSGQPKQPQQSETRIVELKTDGEILKQITTQRLGLLSDQELIQELAINSGYTTDELLLALDETLTPISDEVYDVLAKFTKGNITASLSVIAYFQKVFPLFRSELPEDKAKAESIADLGFRPANPWQISELDISSIAGQMTEDGYVTLYDSPHGGLVIHMTDDPQKVEVFKKSYDNLIEIDESHLPVLFTGENDLYDALDEEPAD